jgi:hypothetical protein
MRNLGNSTEPHVHVQAMDRPGVWFAKGRPLLLEGRELPLEGELLDAVRAGRADPGTKAAPPAAGQRGATDA